MIFLSLCHSLAMASSAFASPQALKAFGLGSDAQPLPASQAFVLAHRWQGQTLTLQWQIANGHYLYQDKLSLQLKHAPQAKVTVDYPPADTIHDPFFGRQKIYRHHLQLQLKVTGYWSDAARLVIHYQGCSGTLCYPPSQQTLLLPKSSGQSAGLSGALYQQHYLWALLVLLGLGILLCFTPCVLPMIPIITGIVLGQKGLSRIQALALSLSYVMGMAICYAVLGLMIARIGAGFQGFLQQPTVIIISAIIFVLLALSLFGVYRIELPHRAQTFLAKLNHRQRGGHLIGAFLMGLLATLVVSPCTSAPLIGVLGYIAQSGNMLFGAIALFVLAVGMGIPLIMIAVVGHHALPKAGLWMYHIQRLLAFLMLAVALWLLSRILPAPITMSLFGLLLISYACVIGLFKRGWAHWKVLQKIIALLIAFYGLLLMMGGLDGNSNFLRPVSFSKSPAKAALPFVRVNDLTQLQAALKKAKQQQQPVLLDFYAHWCVECRKLDAFTFRDPRVKTALAHYRLLRVDVSDNTADDRRLMKAFHIIGLPTLIFYDRQGNSKKSQRLFGDISAAQLLQSIR